MYNDQVRESSNSIHNYLLISFMAILKASTLGHKYIYKKGLNNYYISENNDKTQLHAHDCTISDGKDQLKIEMKTKQSSGLNLQYLKENALLRTSHLLFKKSRWLLVVAVYSKELRQKYNQGDMLGFLNGVQFTMCYGYDYEHKWSELKPLNEWGKIIRSADNIESFFNLISRENTRPAPPPLILLPNDQKVIAHPTLSTKRKSPTPTNLMDDKIKMGKELHDKYGFNKNVIASILGICNSNLSRGDGLKMKSKQTKLTYLFCYMLKGLSLVNSNTSIQDIHVMLDKFISRDLPIREAKGLINSAIKDDFILITDGYRWLDNVDDIKDDQPIILEVQEKLNVLMASEYFKKKLKAYHDNNS